MNPLKVVSFNVGNSVDWQNLAIRAQHPEISYDTSLATFSDEQRAEWDKDFQRKFQELQELEVQSSHDRLVERVFSKIMTDFNPDIFCLQEYSGHDSCYDREKYQTIRAVLERGGFEIVGERKIAIAYKKEAFNPTSNYYCAFSEQNSIGSTRPALYIDLKWKNSGKIIRVISDHVQGFDGREAKKGTAERRAQEAAKKMLADSYAERLIEFKKELIHPDLCHKADGDASFDLSLQSIDSAEVVHERKWYSFHFLQKRQKTPDLIVYGLDANATAKYVSADKNLRLHPKRIRLFEKYGYQFDQANAAPTILDVQEGYPRKYDYVAVKSPSLKILMEDQLIEGINTPDLLEKPSEIVSDHLPVLSMIYFDESFPL